MLSFLIKHFICLLIFVGLDKLVNFLNYSPLCKHMIVPWLLLRLSVVIFRVFVTNIFLCGFLCVYPTWAFLSSFVLWVDIFNWIWGKCSHCFFKHVSLPPWPWDSSLCVRGLLVLSPRSLALLPPPSSVLLSPRSLELRPPPSSVLLSPRSLELRPPPSSVLLSGSFLLACLHAHVSIFPTVCLICS